MSPIFLAWHGAPGARATQTYSTSGFHAGDVLVLAQQATSAITTSGRYDWSMTITVNYATTQTYSVSGYAYVVTQDNSSLGAGWTFSGVDQLIAIAQNGSEPAGVLRVYGSGGWCFYTSAGGNAYTSPAGDNGTLSGNSTTGWTYTTPDGQSLAFKASGQQTSWTSADGQETLQYRWTNSQRTDMTAIDGAVTTFTYTNGLLSTIQAGGRTYLLSDSGTNLSPITNPDSGVHSFSNDTSHHLTGETFATLQNEWGYSSSGMRATMTWGSLTGSGGQSNTAVTTYTAMLAGG